MPGLTAQRTIVKSRPEIWEEIGDVASLARHLGAFGEIRITRATPETVVAWEGDRVRGTVTLERSGWGTKVTVTAEAAEGVAAPEADAGVTDTQEAVRPQDTATDVAGPSSTTVAADDPISEPVPEQEPEPEPAVRSQGFWARIVARWRGRPVAPQPASEPDPPLCAQSEAAACAEAAGPCDPEAPIERASEPEPILVPELDPENEIVLTAMLDHLGAAHHRPFSHG